MWTAADLKCNLHTAFLAKGKSKEDDNESSGFS